MSTSTHRHRDTPHGRNRIIAVATAGVLLLGVLAAVLLGGSDDDPSSSANGDGSSSTTAPDGTGGTSTASPSATGTQGAKGGSPVDPADDAILTPTELEPFLLRGSDLPGGWRTLDRAIEATSKLMGPCMQKAITPTVPHVVKTTSFRSGSNGPVLTASIRDFTTPAQSVRGMAEVRKAVLACTRAGGRPTLRTIAVPSKADSSIAVTFVVTQDGSSARGEVIVAKVGARSATVALIGLTPADLELGKDALRTMVARLD